MPVIPTYGSNKDILDPKKNALVSIVASILSFFISSLGPLLAVLGIVAGLMGTVLSARQKRWGLFVVALLGLLLGAIALIAYITGQLEY